jgi:hypothetical protein
MTTDGPDALRSVAEVVGYYKFTMALNDLAAAWQAEREQAAADRAEIANCLENIRELAAQKRTSDAVIADVREELHIGPGISVVEEAGRVYAALAQARALLTELYDDSPCRFDHHGHCQEHNSMTDVCIMRRIAAALSDGAR